MLSPIFSFKSNFKTVSCLNSFTHLTFSSVLLPLCLFGGGASFLDQFFLCNNFVMNKDAFQ